MKTALLTILMMTSFSGVSMAADKSTDVNSGTYAVERMICSKIYVPATGVQSPTYHAGINAQGKPVVPADINPASGAVANNAPDYVEVPMTIDLAKRMGLAQVGAEMKMPVANLKLYKDGRVEYNGQDISSNAGTLCGTGKKSDASYTPSAKPVNGKFAPHPSSNPSYVSTTSTTTSHIMTTPAMIEPAAGEEQMLAAPSNTVNPDPRNDYQSDSVAPDQVEPQAGSVAASATSTPAPKGPIQLQRATVNMAPRSTH